MQLSHAHNKNLMFDEVKNVKMFLHQHLYSNPAKVQELLDIMSSNFSIFSIEYAPDLRSVQIKVKKTVMKKVQGDSVINGYYKLLDSIFLEYFTKNFEFISSMSGDCEFNQRIASILLNPLYIYTLYNITSISDNIIILYL